jgi:hypothetical protein
LAVIENIAEAARVKPLKAKELLGAPRGRHPDAAHARRVLGSITLKNTNPAALEGSGVGDYKTGCGGAMASFMSTADATIIVPICGRINPNSIFRGLRGALLSA